MLKQPCKECMNWHLPSLGLFSTIPFLKSSLNPKNKALSVSLGIKVLIRQNAGLKFFKSLILFLFFNVYKKHYDAWGLTGTLWWLIDEILENSQTVVPKNWIWRGSQPSICLPTLPEKCTDSHAPILVLPNTQSWAAGVGGWWERGALLSILFLENNLSPGLLNGSKMIAFKSGGKVIHLFTIQPLFTECQPRY